ncbi:hypothetical protein CAOG_04358 [Capsaspora owczarzaki ATCC 30864]|uniref:Uncharacterized protein n=1 Tax=Capsaspora owczarzaki (strain ATCC 30864) TaxID=595528 RepID=A0A0D2VRS2_CAPO3|nr:hypothetical protein CAOG_04358 [Capsaspora owczarzaki ATCC 30864]KJE93597.1 hypothetical protein CAOG_004358 [Capsaspora owczarzaki ATCC 30864]|eukprot:XP_004348186.1 hypothetical protein CAOG_04358 [Capsaspora owczarzaki ATCC 30864]
MIEVDVFWSFAIGACFAACAGRALLLDGSANSTTPPGSRSSRSHAAAASPAQSRSRSRSRSRSPARGSTDSLRTAAPQRASGSDADNWTRHSSNLASLNHSSGIKALLLAPIDAWMAEYCYNKYFVYTVLFLSCVFAPSGAWLLTDYPGWESMYLFENDANVTGPLAALFASTNTLLGVLGFTLATRSIRRNGGSTFGAHQMWIASYACMFSILGFGYRRFLYPASGEEWYAGHYYPLVDFFTSDVFFTLLVMGVPILPGLWIPCYVWLSENRYTKAEKSSILWVLFRTWAVLLGLGTVGFAVYIAAVHFLGRNVSLLPFSAAFHSSVVWYEWLYPLVGFYVANVALFAVSSLPMQLFEVVESKAAKRNASRSVKQS